MTLHGDRLLVDAETGDKDNPVVFDFITVYTGSDLDEQGAEDQEFDRRIQAHRLDISENVLQGTMVVYGTAKGASYVRGEFGDKAETADFAALVVPAPGSNASELRLLVGPSASAHTERVPGTDMDKVQIVSDDRLRATFYSSRIAMKCVHIDPPDPEVY